MKPDADDLFGEITYMEGKFRNNYKEMNRFIIFYKKIRETLKSFYNIKVIEINLPKERLKDLEILPFTFIISINSNEYLLYMKNESEINLTKRELEDYNKLFSENPLKIGFIIVWNDEKLNSIKLGEEDIHSPSENVLEFIQKNIRPFKELIELEFNFSDISNKIIQLSRKEQHELKQLNLIKEFENALDDLLNNFKLKKFKGEKQEIFESIDNRDLEKIKEIFSDFYLTKIDSEKLQQKIKNIVKNRE